MSQWHGASFRTALGRLWVRHGKVFSSFSAIHAMQMALPLLAIPWLARILGPEAFGLLMYSCLIPPLAALFMDWGLGTGGARAAALARGDPAATVLILGAYFSAKLVMFCACALAGGIIWFFLPEKLISPGPYILALGLGAVRSMNPAWFFQGTGHGMPRMAAWDVGASAISLALVILLIQKPGQWPLYLAILLGCKACAYAWILVGIWRRYRPELNLRAGISALKQTAALFGAPFALMVCYNGSQLVLGFFITAIEAGLLGASSKMLRALGSLVNPFAMTLFPELCIMCHKDIKKALHIFKWSLVVAFMGGSLVCALAWTLAPWLVRIALGNGYGQAVPVLRLLVLAIPFMACNSIIASNALIPFGHEKAQARIQCMFALLALPLAAIAGSLWGLYGGAGLAPLLEGGTTMFLLAEAAKCFKNAPANLNALWRPEKDNPGNRRLSR